MSRYRSSPRASESRFVTLAMGRQGTLSFESVLNAELFFWRKILVPVPRPTNFKINAALLIIGTYIFSEYIEQ